MLIALIAITDSGVAQDRRAFCLSLYHPGHLHGVSAGSRRDIGMGHWDLEHRTHGNGVPPYWMLDASVSIRAFPIGKMHLGVYPLLLLSLLISLDRIFKSWLVAHQSCWTIMDCYMVLCLYACVTLSNIPSCTVTTAYGCQGCVARCQISAYRSSSDMDTPRRCGSTVTRPGTFSIFFFLPACR